MNDWAGGSGQDSLQGLVCVYHRALLQQPLVYSRVADKTGGFSNLKRDWGDGRWVNVLSASLAESAAGTCSDDFNHEEIEFLRDCLAWIY